MKINKPTKVFLTLLSLVVLLVAATLLGKGLFLLLAIKAVQAAIATLVSLGLGIAAFIYLAKKIWK